MVFDADELGLDPEDDDEIEECPICAYPVEECICGEFPMTCEKCGRQIPEDEECPYCEGA